MLTYAMQADVVREIEELWLDVTKPDAYTDAKLADFFDLECVALPYFVY
jgi:hypothetical protein